jgi:competence protein ComEC
MLWMKLRRTIPFETRRVRRTTLIIAALVASLIGLWVAQFEPAIPSWIALSGLSLFPLVLSRKPYAFVLVLLIGLSVGVMRGLAVRAEYSRYELLVDQNVTVIGTVIDDSSYNKQGQTEFHIQKIKINGNTYPGKMRISGHVSAFGVERGDQVKASGRLREGFGSYQARISFANVQVLQRDNSLLTKARNAFFASIYTVLPEPQASLGLGFLVGLRALLPDDLLTQLSRTGLTHIVALSGYNLTVLVRMARRGFMPISKFSATAASIFLIVFFLSITGLAPSIFRASIVAILALAAWYYGRPIRPLMLLALSGAVTAFINPFFIWSDIGWWLSFTAFFGVLVLAPLATQRIFKKDGNQLPMPIQIAIETTCAQIMALPIIVVIFGELSLISIVANILIVPFIPITMALTFVAGVGGIIFQPIAGWLALPAHVALAGMTAIITLLAEIPWALIEIDVGWSVALVWYASVLLVAGLMYRTLSNEQRSAVASANYLE